MSDEDRINWLEKNKERIFCLCWEPSVQGCTISENPVDRYSGCATLGEGETIRAVIDDAIKNDQTK